MNSSTAKSCDYGSDELEHIAAFHCCVIFIKDIDFYDEYLKSHTLDYSDLNIGSVICRWGA